MTSAVYDKVFATIKEEYGVEKVTFSHLICEMAKYRSGTVTLNLDDDTYTKMYQKIIEDM
jgi:hypothetical protein